MSQLTMWECENLAGGSLNSSLAAIQGIMARSFSPTFSMSCSAALRRIALKLAWPAAFSSTQSRANRPDWMSSRTRFISALTASLMMRGPRV